MPGLLFFRPRGLIDARSDQILEDELSLTEMPRKWRQESIVSKRVVTKTKGAFAGPICAFSPVMILGKPNLHPEPHFGSVMKNLYHGGQDYSKLQQLIHFPHKQTYMEIQRLL